MKDESEKIGFRGERGMIRKTIGYERAKAIAEADQSHAMIIDGWLTDDAGRKQARIDMNETEKRSDPVTWSGVNGKPREQFKGESRK
jgi:hypothetical protein